MTSTDAQKRANNKYNERNKVIACKINKDKAEEVEKYLKSNGYTSFNDYIKKLITTDSGIEL